MLARSDRQWQILVSEYKVCRRKLQSKRDAHQIMLNMLSDKESENEMLKKKLLSLEKAADDLMANNTETDNLKKFKVPKDCSKEGRSTIEGLILMMYELKNELESKTQLISKISLENMDLKKDLKALRADRLGYNRVTSPIIDRSAEKRDSREEMLHFIQTLTQEVDVCNTKIKTLNDESTDLKVEREVYKQKLKSVTEKLHVKNECKPIADIENLLEDNHLLRDKVDKLQHINAALVAHNSYPSRAPYSTARASKKRGKRSSKHVTFLGYDEEEEGDEEVRLGHGFIRSVKEKVKVETELQHLQQLTLDMQKVSNGLAETVLDKSTALKHQRASNRLLGERVTELEAKLRALEMSGFWSVPDGYHGNEEERKREVLRRLTLRGGCVEEEEGGVSGVGVLVDPFEDAPSLGTASSGCRPSSLCDDLNLLLSPEPPDEEADEHSALLTSPTPPAYYDQDKNDIDLLPVKEV